MYLSEEINDLIKDSTFILKLDIGTKDKVIHNFHFVEIENIIFSGNGENLQLKDYRIASIRAFSQISSFTEISDIYYKFYALNQRNRTFVEGLVRPLIESKGHEGLQCTVIRALLDYKEKMECLSDSMTE